jgi:hypothetical protein
MFLRVTLGLALPRALSYPHAQIECCRQSIRRAAAASKRRKSSTPLSFPWCANGDSPDGFCQLPRWRLKIAQRHCATARQTQDPYWSRTTELGVSLVAPSPTFATGPGNGLEALRPRIREAARSRASGLPRSSECRDARTARPNEEQRINAIRCGLPKSTQAKSN